jgi:acyl-CoA synthetase (NDP forming)
MAELLARFPVAPTKGAGVLTFSGAFCAIAHDYFGDLGIDIPELSPEVQTRLQKRLPSFATARNPLDLTTQPIWEPDLMEVGTKGLLDDPNNGSLTISIPCGNPQASVIYIQGVVNAMKGSTKPVIFSALGDGAPLPAEFTKIAKDNGIIVMSSSERAMRATAALTQHGRRLAVPRASGKPQPIPGLPAMGHGTLPEYLGKEVLKAAGIAVPAGGLAKTVEDAVAMAKKIGYPVVMKAQAGALAHKTEAGGVLLNIADEAAVRAGWTTLVNNVQKAKPGITIDGMLVEKMAGRGLELVVGAKRDPKWGPVIMVGLGGIFVEALGDVRLLPADLPESAIVAELDQLQAHKLLKGFRGSPAVDKAAVAKVTATIGRLMLTQPEILEIDVNPLVATTDGVFALDALIITE